MTDDGPGRGRHQGVGDEVDKKLLEQVKKAVEAIIDDLTKRGVSPDPEELRRSLIPGQYQLRRQERLRADIEAAQGRPLSLTGRDLRGLNLRGDADNPAANLADGAVVGAVWDVNTKWP